MRYKGKIGRYHGTRQKNMGNKFGELLHPTARKAYFKRHRRMTKSAYHRKNRFE